MAKAFTLNHVTGPGFVLTAWTLISWDRWSALAKAERTSSQSIWATTVKLCKDALTRGSPEMWLLSAPLGFFQPWDSDFRICFYSPARLLYWFEYIWGYFSSSKVIQRQPPHLPMELSVGTVDWLIERLTRRLRDSLCSIDAPKHVYHCVCRSKMTLLFPHLCKYSCKKWCTASRSSPRVETRELTPSGLAYLTHPLRNFNTRFQAS